MSRWTYDEARGPKTDGVWRRVILLPIPERQIQTCEEREDHLLKRAKAEEAARKERQNRFRRQWAEDRRQWAEDRERQAWTEHPGPIRCPELCPINQANEERLTMKRLFGFG